MIGFPEAGLTLSHATIALALAPKSNAATTAIGAALDDVRKGHAGPVPAHLRDSHYKGAGKLGHGQGYVYPHDLPEGIAAQQYAPDELKDRTYYTPTRHGAEARYADAVGGPAGTSVASGPEQPVESPGAPSPVQSERNTRPEPPAGSRSVAHRR